MSTTFHKPINNVATTVGSSRSSGAGTLVVAAGTGTAFGATFPLIITVARAGAVLCILEVTGRSTDTLTISGAIEGTADAAMVVGDVVEMRPTALSMTEVHDAVHTIEAAYASTTYVDLAVAALAPKNDCQCATITALAASTYANGTAGVGATLTANVAAVLVIDGYTPALNDRVLVKNQSNAFENGLYYVSRLGVSLSVTAILTRTLDFDQPGDGVNGALVYILSGTVNSNTLWSCTTNATITFGSTNINWSQFTGTTYTADESTLHLSGTTFSIKSTYTGQTSIVTLGTIATGTWQGTAVAIGYGGTGQATASAGFNALSPVTTLGDLIYGSAANTNSRLAGNTTGTKKFLRQTGTGSVSAAPAWDTVAAGDLPTVALVINQHTGLITGDSDGATITFDLSVTDWHTVTLAANRILALSNEGTNQQFTLVLVQGGSGSNTVTWFSTIKWAGGSAPTLTTTTGKADVFTFKQTSAGNYYGFVAGQNL